MRIQKAFETIMYCLAWPALARIIKTNTYLLSVRQSSCYIPDHFRLNTLHCQRKIGENNFTFLKTKILCTNPEP